jgi:uncharacterized membrane protein
VLYFPFYLGFQSQAGAPFILPMLMRPTRLPHFLVIFGMPLVVLVLFLGGLAIRQRMKNGWVMINTAVFAVLLLTFTALLFTWLIASTAIGSGTVINIANELGRTIPPHPGSTVSLGWGARAVSAILPAYLGTKIQYGATTLLLAVMLGIIIMVWTTTFQSQISQSPDSSPHLFTPSPLPFILLLIFTATLLTIGPEFVYLKDNFGARLNTVFKFYYQAWVMFGIGAIVALEVMWREWQNKLPSAVAGIIYLVLLISAFQFPYYAVRSRSIEYRGAPTAENRLPATLDGLAKLQRFNPDEYEAIMWLSENSDGLPVVLEATGGAYSSYGRVSANTGLPTVLGWANHEYQWRGSDTPEPAQRTPTIEQIYSNPFWDNSGDLLNRYDVEYIYVGGLERSTYGNGQQLPALENFNQLLEVAYQNNSVTIYRWQPEE